MDDHWTTYHGYATKIGSPFAPHNNVLTGYRYLADGMPDSPDVLILGAAAGLLDIFPSHRVQKVVVEKSQQRIDSTIIPYVRANPRSNTFLVFDDWQTMSLSRRFDIVIRDGFLNSMPFEMVTGVLRTVLEHMNPGKLFISRTYLSPPSAFPSLFTAEVLNLLRLLRVSFSAFRMLLMMKITNRNSHQPLYV